MKGTIARSTLTRYLTFSPKDTRPDREKGRRDGQSSYPENDANEFSPHELERVSQAKAALTTYHRQLHETEAQLRQTIAANQRENSEGYLNQKELIITQKETAIENGRVTDGPMSSKEQELQTHYDEKQEAHRKIELTLNRPLRVHFIKSYLVILLALSVLEIPINKLAFEFFFEETPLIALVMAFTAGLVLVSLSHFCGMWLRQIGYCTEQGHKVYSFGLLAMVTVAGSLIFLISTLRQQYVDFISDNTQQDIATLLLQDGIGGLLERSFTTELGIAGLTLLAINTAIFLMGAIFAFLRHDPHPDYENVFTEREKSRATLYQYRTLYNRSFIREQKDFDKKISYLNRRSEELENEVSKIENQLVALYEQKKHDINLVVDGLRQQLLAYQSGNVETRTSKAPEYFGEKGLNKLRQRIMEPS